MKRDLKILTAAFIVGVLAALVFGCSGCTPHPAPTPVTPVGLDAGGDTPCASWCEIGTRLGCRWAQPTPGGHSCIEVCRNANDPAGPIAWDFECRLGRGSSSCDAEARCQ